MVEVYALNLNEIIDDNDLFFMETLISDKRLIKLNKYRFLWDKKRSLFGEILVRFLAINKYNIRNIDIKIVYNHYGKPSIENIPDFHYNISHSGNWIVCATGEFEVGIDVQEIKPIELDVAKRFFTKQEYIQLLSKNETEKLSFFYELWTLKEAYVKALGNGLSIPLNSFSIEITDSMYTCLSNVVENKKLEFMQYTIGEGYKTAVCTFSDSFDNDIKKLKLNNLLNIFKKQL